MEIDKPTKDSIISFFNTEILVEEINLIQINEEINKLNSKRKSIIDKIDSSSNIIKRLSES